MLGHNSFDFALTPTNRVFMADVTKSGIYKWKSGMMNYQDPAWGTDTRTWEYGDYTIIQTSKKQKHSKVGDSLWYKYQTTTIATDKVGRQIEEIEGPTLTYDDYTRKFSQIDIDRNTLANAMQAELDAQDLSVSDSGSGGGTTGSEDTDPNDCASENRNVNTDETCGDCLSGYSEDDDSICVADEPEEEEKKTNWLLYGGIAAAVAAFAFMG